MRLYSHLISIRRWLLHLIAALVGAMTLLVGWDITTYDSRAWLSDYASLKQAMARGYANLDWIASHRRVDLAALDRETTVALTGAHSRVRAYLALRRFVRTFNDPHLRLRRRQSTQALSHSDLTGCAAAGYAEGDHGFRFPFTRMPGWQDLSVGDFASGMIGNVGVLRIAQFGENRYLGTCQRVFQSKLDARVLQLRVRAQLQRQLIERLEQLQARGATRLLVDVTGNGGGTEWAVEVIALMTDRTLSRAAARVVAPTCDRAAVWQGNASCPVFGATTTRREIIGTGTWTGPVLILADTGTGSASEEFVAWLQQNGVATVIGERTAGAGCGYVDGGVRVVLREAPLEVMMPNCARFLEDGRNEIEGLTPDVPLALSTDDAPVRLAAWLDTHG